MGFGSVIGFSLVIGVLAVIGVSVVSYMSSLVRNAYEIKVEMRKDLDDGIRLAKTESLKQIKIARTELMAEVEKIRGNMLEEHKQRQAHLEAVLAEQLRKREEAWQAEHAALSKDISLLRTEVEGLRAMTRSRHHPAQSAGATAAPADTAADAQPITLAAFTSA